MGVTIMRDDKNNQNQNDYHQNAQLGMLGMLGVAALVWKNEDKIRYWFYQNTLYLVLGGIGLLAIAGLYLWHRFKKKEKAYFENLRKVRAIEAGRNDNQYYQRKGSNERNINR